MEVMDSGDIFLVGGFFMGRWGSNGRTGYYHTWVVKCLYNPLGPPQKNVVFPCMENSPKKTMEWGVTRFQYISFRRWSKSLLNPFEGVFGDVVLKNGGAPGSSDFRMFNYKPSIFRYSSLISGNLIETSIFHSASHGFSPMTPSCSAFQKRPTGQAGRRGGRVHGARIPKKLLIFSMIPSSILCNPYGSSRTFWKEVRLVCDDVTRGLG